MEQPVSIVILAAGLGSRMKSKLAKVLHRAGGACLLEHVVFTAREITNPENIVAVVGHQADEVRRQVEGHGIRFQTQTEQNGTGHAVLCCDGMPGLDQGRLMVVYGDGPLLSASTLKGLLAAHENSGAVATLITTQMEVPTGYGRIIHTPDGHVSAIIEEKAATEEEKKITEVNPGIYCFETAHLWSHLRGLKPNPASGEIYLTDVVESFVAAGLKVAAFPVADTTELMGINNRVELADVDRIFRQRKSRELMVNGVTLELPQTVVIDRAVNAGQDTVVGPFVQLTGNTTIGEGCRIGACSILHNATLGNDVEVLPFSHIADSAIADGAQVGPYARLRMNAHVDVGAHIGNFVELKKTHLGAGAKASHLAYLGDSEIGKNVNIGAGTITCNYDGKNKHRTTIGEGAFVGSNSTLVAPVTVGAGSYVAAGSVITSEIPPDALGVGRSRQENKNGWAKRRRESQGSK